MNYLILLAAGKGSRFGANKLLAPFRRCPLWTYGYRALKEAAKKAGGRVIVVSRYPEILAEVPEEGVFSPESENGLSFSIRAGVLSCGELAAGDKLLFLAADMPFLTAETVQKLLETPLSASEKDGLPLAACTFDGEETGNPVVFSALLREKLLSLTGDRGGKAILRDCPDRVEKILCAKEELTDVDHPSDLTEKTEDNKKG